MGLAAIEIACSFFYMRTIRWGDLTVFGDMY